MSEHELRQLFEAIRRLTDVVLELKREIHTMSTSIVTRDQFDAALTAAVTTITTSINDLLAKIAAGTVTTPEDFTAELNTLQGLAATALSADPGTETPPVETPAS